MEAPAFPSSEAPAMEESATDSPIQTSQESPIPPEEDLEPTFIQPETGTDAPEEDTAADPEVLQWPRMEVVEKGEGTVGRAENDTATFSAATMLSGDGEAEHGAPAYLRLLDADSELDYQYDMAEAYLPVSPDPLRSTQLVAIRNPHLLSFPLLPNFFHITLHLLTRD